MSASRTCQGCGAEVPPDAPPGHCANCLIQLGLGGGSSPEGGTVSLGFNVPPFPEAHPPPAQRFGDYELLGEIAHGGMGVIYKARQLSLNRTVAVKMIRAGPFASKEFVHRFRVEASAAAVLQHPNIVAVHEVGVHEGQHFFSMDYVAGKNLAQIASDGPLPANRAARYVQKIAEAIHYAHQSGILHRDLKPSNVLIDQNDQPRITDFGLAKQLNSESSATLTGDVMGTPGYMPPEQASGNRGAVKAWSDVYSIGAILYHLLTGRAPFAAGTLEATLNQMLHQDPVSLRLLNPAVPHDLNTICLKCLEKEPAQRYGSAQLLADELTRFLNQEPIQARPIGAPEKVWRWCKRKPMTATALGLVIVVAIGSPVVALRIYRESQKTHRALQQAQLEEGKAWLERAQSYLEEKNPFYAKLMASRAIGFRGFGRDKLTEEQKQKFPELFPPGNAEAREVELILRGIDDYSPIWRAGATNADGSISSSEVGVEFSPDGRLLASVWGSTNIALYETATGTMKATLHGHSAAIQCVAFSPDSRLLASAGDDQTIRLWDAVAQTNLTTLKGYSRGLQMVAFSPDSRRLAACGYIEKTIRIWELPGCRLESELAKRPTDGYSSFAFSPDGTKLAAGGCDGIVELWDLVTLQLRTNWPGGSREIWDLAFSPNGGLLAIASMDTTVKLWRMPGGEPIKELQGHLSDVHNVKFSPDGKTLASREHNGPIRLWAMPHGGFRAVLRPSTPLTGGGHHDMCFSPDGSLIAAAGLVQLWELTSGHVEAELTAHSSLVLAVAISPDGTWLASGSADRTLVLWDLASRSLKHELLHPLGVGAAAFSPDNQWLASGCQDGIVRLWDVATGRLEAELRGHRGHVKALAFSSDRKSLASISDNDDVVRLWDVPQQKAREPIVLTHRGDLWDLALDPRGRWLALAGEDPSGPNPYWVKVWDLATGQLRTPPMTSRQRYYSVRFSRDGRLLAAWKDRGTLDLWDVDSGKLKAQWSGHSDQVLSLDFSPDGRLFASASRDHTIEFWDVAGARLLGRLAGHSAGVRRALFTPDGRSLVSGSEDTTIRIWSVAAALNRPLDYGGFMNWFDLEGRTITWKGSNPTTNPSVARDLPMKSFTGRSLVSILQSGLPEEELDRTLFRRFLRSGNLNSARLLLDRHGQQQRAGSPARSNEQTPQRWKEESETLGRAYLREAKTVLEYEGYHLAAQHAARARTLLPGKAAQAWHVTALAERASKNWSNAIAALEQAITLEANNPELWHDKALILEQQDDKRVARQALAQAIDLARKANEKDPRLESWRQHLEQLGR